MSTWGIAFIVIILAVGGGTSLYLLGRIHGKKDDVYWRNKLTENMKELRYTREERESLVSQLQESAENVRRLTRINGKLNDIIKEQKRTGIDEVAAARAKSVSESPAQVGIRQSKPRGETVLKFNRDEDAAKAMTIEQIARMETSTFTEPVREKEEDYSHRSHHYTDTSSHHSNDSSNHSNHSSNDSSSGGDSGPSSYSSD